MSRVWADDLFDAWVEVEDVGGGLQRFVLVWCQVDREHAARRVEGDDQALFRAADRGERCSLGDSSRLVGAEGEPYFGHVMLPSCVRRLRLLLRTRRARERESP